MKESIIQTKSYYFALRIVNAYIFLSKEKQEYVLSKQLLRSGTTFSEIKEIVCILAAIVKTSKITN